MIQTKFPWLLALALAALPQALAQTEEKVLNWPDGTVKVRFTVDAQGRKNGACTEFNKDGTIAVKSTYKDDALHGPFEKFHPAGGPAITAAYAKGQLTGPYVETSVDGARVWNATFVDGKVEGEAKLISKGTVTITQKWRNGQILTFNRLTPHPRPAAEIRTQIQRLLDRHAPEQKPVHPPLDPNRELRFAGFQRLKAYRYLAGLPYDELVLDPALNDMCDAAAEVCEKLGDITHTPRDPGGLAPGRYEKGRVAAGKSNLSRGRDSIARTIDDYFDDSDASNIAALGHRRWCLNPTLKRTGLGWSNRFSAMWAHDESGVAPKGLQPVCWPPAGYVPRDFFAPHIAWCVSFLIGAWPAYPKPHVVVEPLDEHYIPAGPPLTIAKAWLADGKAGVANCVAFSPQGIDVSPGHTYYVKLSIDGGKTSHIEYLVEFFDRLAAESRR